ncbi:DegT/DnrJ/EryC1/StrS family aminotransferase [Candidatus Woesearchaeota archaeon]|nr:DegT/DnrJ/EryC1/StrS family aminotransferase [Candidatus Woesearchaeota archaeon]
MQQILERLRQLTGSKYIQLTERGNNSLLIALTLVKDFLDKEKVLIQDQGGWITYKQYPKKLGLEIIELKTDHGLIDLTDLEDKADENSILLINSTPGYAVFQDMQKIQEACKRKRCLLINDVSGSIGTDTAKIGDIIFGSFGRWKPINVEYGGFIATNNDKYYEEFAASYFEEHKYDELIKKIEELPQRLEKLQEARKKILEDLQSFNIIHKCKKGINVIIKFDDDEVKQRIIDYCKENKLEFTECPRYIRINEPAISIEVKRL